MLQTFWEKIKFIDLGLKFINRLREFPTKHKNLYLNDYTIILDNNFIHLKYLHLLSPPYLTSMLGCKVCCKLGRIPITTSLL